MPTALRIEALAAKLESTYATDAVPDASTDAVRGSERMWTLLNVDHAFPNRRDDVVNNSLRPAPPAARKGRFVTFELPWELRGAGSAYAAASDIEADPILQACGLSAAVDTTADAETVTYTPADTGHASATIYLWAGGSLYKIVGCRSDWRWPITAGENGIFRFPVSGLLLEDPAPAAAPTASYLAELPPAAVGVGLTLDSWTPQFRSAEFNLGADVQQIEDGNASDGLHGYEIPAMDPEFTAEVRAGDLSSDYDPYALAEAGTKGTIDLTIGDTQYNRAKLDVDDAYPRVPGHIEYNQFAGWNLRYEVTDFSLIFD